jgi:predicted nucleotidyltransferase
MKNAVINRQVIRTIAKALAELNEQVIYVGGATVGLYINDPAADDVRPTKDVDISLSVANFAKLEEMREKLKRKGFRQTAEDDVICRFRYNEIKLDVMNTRAIGWAPANPWFAPGFDSKEIVTVEGQNIYVMPVYYFLASKFTAFNERGNNEPRTSHDFEDIIYIFDNRTDLVEQVLKAPDDVKIFLKKEIGIIIQDTRKQEAILGNLYHETRDERFEILMKKLKAILSEH